ncbi:HAD family hydrolase [Mucilaginibacter segetis]|uniref:HAD family hydrolase n=1 Tax=Mucilaginibacter segetis TaxID=2793071 RepID=A0A934UMR4_9SPHI|nr:HAD family hydrolase [Mucilaginibacter segetis]MBK0379146.1 HAD family hydrolase [Mucilaginibacter segetis]
MKKRVLILDLDNTIYPVSSIADKLFGRLFQLIDEELPEESRHGITKAKDELTRRPYQHVADEFGFGAELTAKGIELLKNITFNEPMVPYEQYATLQSINIDKYLVTTGFTKLQTSKVKMLGIEADFKGIYIVDPEQSTETKKDVFFKIIKENHYTINDVLVIGDDPQSEIKAANELGIDTFLFDPKDMHVNASVTYRSASYNSIINIIS